MIFKNWRKILLFCVGAFILIAAIFLLKGSDRTAEQTEYLENSLTGSASSTEELFYSINGLQVDKGVALQRPLAVMIENHSDARPQSGLSHADVVYEILAEGGITRFLALYQSGEVKQIGPVRSAREYFAQIADEWGALYAHVGGSNEVIKQLKNGAYKNLADADEYYNFDFFPRKKNKPEPHHIFTSTQKLRELIEYHKFSNLANYSPWLFKEDSPAISSTASKISIDFSRAGYEAAWEYDQASNAYKRLQYFKPHLDEDSGQQVTAKNIVVQIVDVTPVPGDLLLQVDIDLDSGGRAIIFRDDISIEGAWSKQDGRTRFQDSSGQEIRFNRGVLWIELVPKDKQQGLSWQ